MDSTLSPEYGVERMDHHSWGERVGLGAQSSGMDIGISFAFAEAIESSGRPVDLDIFILFVYWPSAQEEVVGCRDKNF